MGTFNQGQPALSRRWTELCRKQQLARRAAMKRAEKQGASVLREKIPAKARQTLELAFAKAFSLIFEQGKAVLEKTYSSEKLARGYIARDLAIKLDGDTAYFDSSRGLSKTGNMLLTTLEGVGLGALGIGLPDIILFTAMLIRGVYETALQYGYDYEKDTEKLYILSLMECAMLSGWSWVDADAHLEAMGEFPEAVELNPQVLEIQLKRTASAFATDLLVLKFIQGLPIVGLVGGLSNPVYYRKVMKYAELKYQRRYIKAAMEKVPEDR